MRITDSSVLKASQAVSKASQQLHTELLTMPQVEPSHLITESINIHTEYEYGPTGRTSKPKYVVHQSLRLTLMNADGDLVATAIDRMVNAAGNALQLNGVSVRVGLRGDNCPAGLFNVSPYRPIVCVFRYVPNRISTQHVPKHNMTQHVSRHTSTPSHVQFGVAPSIQEQLVATARKMACEDARAKAQLYCEVCVCVCIVCCTYCEVCVLCVVRIVKCVYYVFYVL